MRTYVARVFRQSHRQRHKIYNGKAVMAMCLAVPDDSSLDLLDRAAAIIYGLPSEPYLPVATCANLRVLNAPNRGGALWPRTRARLPKPARYLPGRNAFQREQRYRACPSWACSLQGTPQAGAIHPYGALAKASTPASPARCRDLHYYAPGSTNPFRTNPSVGLFELLQRTGD